MANFPTCLERRETGQLRRKQTPRQDHGKIKIPHRNPVALLEASARGRIPSLIALKYQLIVGLGLRLLPRGCAGDGLRSRRAAEYRNHLPALRRRARAQLRRLCLAGRRPTGLSAIARLLDETTRGLFVSAGREAAGHHAWCLPGLISGPRLRNASRRCLLRLKPIAR